MENQNKIAPVKAGAALRGFADAANAGFDALKAGAKQVHQAFGGEYGDKFAGTLKNEEGNYVIPNPLVDEREYEEIATLTKRYEKALAPGPIAKAGKTVIEKTPQVVKEIAGKAGNAVKDTFNGLTEQELIAGAIKKATEGFGELEKHAARASVSKEYVLQRINSGKQEQKVSDISEICMLRSYDVAAIANGEHVQHIGIALIEGGGTGAAGFWGLPANFALSMLIYFRAVQSVALFYGYDVKNDPDELVISSEVFSKSMSPNAENTPANDYVGKILVYTEMAGVKKAAAKTWTAMIEAGGASLVLAQMRAMANKAARKALEKGGQKTLEAGIFKKTLAQIGNKLSLETIGKMVPFVGAGFGALFDTAQMSQVLKIADLFYHKRFILEKQERIERLCGQAARDAAEANDEYLG